MIRKLRKRFILAAMFAIIIVLEGIMIIVNVANYRNTTNRADRITHMIADGVWEETSLEDKIDPGAKNDENASPDGGGGASENTDLSSASETSEKSNSSADDTANEKKDPSADGTANEKKDPSASGMAPGKTDSAANNPGSGETDFAADNTAPEKRDSTSDSGIQSLFSENWTVASITEETQYQVRYFTVTMDESGNISETNTDKIVSVTDDEAEQYASSIADKTNSIGYMDEYRYRIVNSDDGTRMLIFLSQGDELYTVRHFAIISFGVSGIGLLAVFILVVVFSKMVFKPVAESYEKQKRFITDASHELKTPLTIIDANTEILEMEHGESSWTRSNRNQVRRLSSLTQQLITLSKMDEDESLGEKTTFSLSDAMEEYGEFYRAPLLTQHKTMILDIENDILYTGDEKSLRQMLDILFDNAVKYSLEDTEIRVSLHKKGSRINLTMTNKCDPVPKGKLNQIFERFYRLDTARNSETGGSGIGLAVAKAVVEAHKGTIHAHSDDGHSMVIEITL